jgi:hypothetical protein
MKSFFEEKNTHNRCCHHRESRPERIRHCHAGRIHGKPQEVSNCGVEENTYSKESRAIDALFET